MCQRSWDHPRACGEHLVDRVADLVNAGSSPRLRGTHASRRRRRDRGGIIPALAGNTADLDLIFTRTPDHPRACGEHYPLSSCNCTVRGSSPRLRGTPTVVPQRGLHGGIIPALAGNTFGISPPCARMRDHPRACGEHSATLFSWIFIMGSSPRLRGTQPQHPWRRRCPGIIPALAGNTAKTICTHRNRRDHPRACGEHFIASNVATRLMGSSPRLRGTRAGSWGWRRPNRIIPALAGNTKRVTWNARPSGDHPRACGEHITPNPLANAILGSSPRLRGTRIVGYCGHAVRGIIPALAGNTMTCRYTRTCSRDHPRACGEHSPTLASAFNTLGSSPRLRGTPRGNGARLGRLRIIPALAGNTHPIPPRRC